MTFVAFVAAVGVVLALLIVYGLFVLAKGMNVPPNSVG